MSRRIERYTSLDVPAVLARKELMRIMKAIHAHQAPFEDAALHVGLHDLHLPGSGDVAIQFHTDVQDRPLQYSCGIKIEASGGARFFPRFSGTITVSALGSSASELWLQGQYDAPLGKVGAAIDATLLKGAAERSLDGLLNLVAQTIADDVKREQADEMRQRRHL